MKTKGAIAAGHRVTAEAAQTVLASGGNAFDAACAALMASFVAEPGMSSPGGGIYVNVHTSEGENFILDGFCQTPAHKKPESELDFFPVDIDFGTTVEVFQIGLGSMAIPGSMGAMFRIHKDLGSLPLLELAQPAIRAALAGVEVDEFQFHDFHLLRDILAHTQKHSDMFFPDGRFIQLGDRQKMPGMADFLESICREGEELFYKGEIAKEIVQNCREQGGMITAEDLSGYRVEKRQPLAFPYRGRHIHTNPLPSIGGSLLTLIMHSLASGEISPFGTPEFARALLRGLHFGYQAPRNPQELYDWVQKHAPEASGPAWPDPAQAKINGTSHLSVLDAAGNAIAISTTNGEGCGYVISGTDIQMNNMLGEAALMPDGYHSWPEASRLASMMSPTIVTNQQQEVELVLGSGGAGRIPGAIAQVMHHVLDQGMSIQEAVKAPRIHWHEGVCNVEPGLHGLLQANEFAHTIKEWEKGSLYFGGVHALHQKEGVIEGQPDERRDGVMLFA